MFPSPTEIRSNALPLLRLTTINTAAGALPLATSLSAHLLQALQKVASSHTSVHELQATHREADE